MHEPAHAGNNNVEYKPHAAAAAEPAAVYGCNKQLNREVYACHVEGMQSRLQDGVRI